MKQVKLLMLLGGVTLASACSGSAPKPEIAPAPVVIAPPKPKMTPEQRFAEGQKALTAKDYPAAQAAFEKLVKERPDSVAALYNLGYSYEQQAKLTEAQAAYRKVLAKDPTHVEAAANLGGLLRERGERAEAIKITETALKADPFNGLLLNNLSLLYRETKAYDKGIAALRKLLSRDKDNIDAYKNLALISMDQGKQQLSQTILENALNMAKKQDKADPDLYVNLGRLYLAREQNGKAMANFKLATQLEPTNLAANYNIGALALSHRDYALAEKAYTIAEKQRPRDPEVAASLGYAYQGLQDFKSSASWLETARERRAKLGKTGDAEDLNVLKQLIAVQQSAENLPKALQYAEEYMKVEKLKCTDQDFDGFCGRYNGIKMTIQMEKDAASEAAKAAKAAEAEKKPKAGKVDVFTDEPVEDETAPEGEAAPAGEAAPEGSAPADAAPPASGEVPAS